MNAKEKIEYEKEQAETKERLKRQDAKKALQKAALLERIRILVPPIFQKVDPISIFPSQNKEKNTNGVFLTGPIGVGKSYKAAQLFLRWVWDENRDGCMWWYVPELLEQMRAEFTRPVSPTITQKCLKAPILVLDDLGSEKVTDWTQDRISLIVCGRYDKEKPTIVTSNLSLDKIEQQDARVGDRLHCYYSNDMKNENRRRK